LDTERQTSNLKPQTSNIKPQTSNIYDIFVPVNKALIITYYWPPSGGAGVQRWLKFVKYMRDYGWEPVVYTAEEGEMPAIDHSLAKDVPLGVTVLKRKIWEPYTLYKKFSGRKKSDRINASFLSEEKKPGLAEKLSVWVRGNFFIPDARMLWIRPSIRFLNGWLKHNAVDCIISTGPPHSMHLIALGLKRRNPSLKWVADFRDPWTGIDFYDKLMLMKLADIRHRWLERTVLMSADSVIAVGARMTEELRQIYVGAGGKDPKKFHTITNGYDEDDLLKGHVPLDPNFSIAHIGSLVKDRNAPELWRVLSELVRERDEIAERLEIKLVGKVDIHVREELDRLGLTPYVKYIAYLPHDAVIAEQQRSHVLLLLVNRSQNSKSIVTGKVFEYMISGRPVLAIGPLDGELAAILFRTNAGLISDFNDHSNLKANVLALFRGEYPPAIHAEIANYSRKALTARLANVLDGLVRKKMQAN
jgi:glycosyltransferase involved in cell wall biosynthesis